MVDQIEELKRENRSLRSTLTEYSSMLDKYRTLAECSLAGIYVIQNERFQYVNPRFTRMLGYEREEDLIGLDFREVVHEEDRPLVSDPGLRRGKGFVYPDRYTFRAIRKDGSVAWLDLSNVAARYMDQPAYIGTVVDITEQRESEEALLQSEEKYRTIIEQIEDGYYEVDLKGKFTFFNDSFARIPGYLPEDLLGVSYKECAAPQEAQTIDQTFSKVYATGGPARAVVWEICRKDGVRRHIELSVSLIRDRQRHAIGFRGMARDITERKQVEEELRRHRNHLEDLVRERSIELVEANEHLRQEVAERTRAEAALLASEKELRVLSAKLMSAQETERQRVAMELHDGIGQALTAIKVHVESVMKTIPHGQIPAEVAPLWDLIPMIQQTVEDVRRLSRDLRPSMLDKLGILSTISWFCRQFEKLYPNIAMEKRIEIEEAEVPEHLKIVIFRIVQEASNNVAKHSRSDRLTVDLGRRNGGIELVIQDNGVGFDLDSTLMLDSDKRGFGLASMKERTELSGGEYDLLTGPGLGAAIRAFWPPERLSLSD